jgi:hypothetical protein
MLKIIIGSLFTRNMKYATASKIQGYTAAEGSDAWLYWTA